MVVTDRSGLGDTLTVSEPFAGSGAHAAILHHLEAQETHGVQRVGGQILVADFHIADQPGAGAMRASHQAGFRQAGPQALAAHFQQAKMADLADLDAGAIIAQRILHRLFDGTRSGGDGRQRQLHGDLERPQRLQLGRARAAL